MIDTYLSIPFRNEATCDAIGFFTQFSGVAAMLPRSCYFMLTTLHRYSDVDVAIQHETAMHVVCLGLPMLSAYAALYLDFYGEREVNLGCWIRRDIPENCRTDGTGESCKSLAFNALFGGIPMSLCFLTLIFNNVRIWTDVRKQGQAHKERLGNAYANNGSPNVNRAFQQLAETQKEYEKKLKRHRKQAELFVGGFLVCNFITYGLRAKESMAQADIDIKELQYRSFGPLILQALLYPLQGWVNMFVFLRPSYIRLRINFPSEIMATKPTSQYGQRRAKQKRKG